HRDIPDVFACIYLHGFSFERSSESNTAEKGGSTGEDRRQARIGLNLLESPRYPLFVMQGLTARLLLILIAMGLFQPLVEALSPVPPHACCLRRLHALPNQPAQFHDAAKAGGNCCPPLTTPHTANPVSLDRVRVAAAISGLKLVSQDRLFHDQLQA